MVKPNAAADSESSSTFAEWCRVTAWHGILDFYTAKNTIIKIAWLLVVSMGCLLAVNQSVSMISDFASSDQWVTSVTYEAPEGEKQWPDLMVCGQYWPGSHYLDTDLPLEDVDAMRVLLGRDDEEMRETIRKYKVPAEVEEMLSDFARTFENPAFDQENFDSAVCDRVVIHCGNIKNFNLKLPAKCCTKESKRRNGRSFGAYYLFKPELNDYFGHTLFPGTGLEVRLFMDQWSPYDDYCPTFLLEPGTHNIISMTLEKHRAVSRGNSLIRFFEPNTVCDAYKSYKYTFLDKSQYSPLFCAIDCTIQRQLEVCGCYEDFGVKTLKKSLDSYRSCEKREARNCWRQLEFSHTRQAYSYFASYDTVNATSDISSYRKCYEQCPEMCDRQRIEAKISSAKLVPPKKAKTYTRYVNRAMMESRGEWTNMTEDEVKQLILLEVYYENKQNRVIQRMTRLSVDELISNIGGCVGVWSGISLISVVQILFYSVKGVVSLLVKRNKVQQAKK